MVDELARERAAVAHSRLDTINGQIAKLAEHQGETRADVASLKTMAKIGGAVAMALLTATLALMVAILTRHPETTARNATSRSQKATHEYSAAPRFAGRERGLGGRTDGP